MTIRLENTNCNFRHDVPDKQKPRACLESLREASCLTRGLQYAHSCAFVNPKIKSLMGRPAFVPIERCKSVRIRTKPSLGHHGDASRYAAGELHRDCPGFRPLECWYELRDSQDGLVSSKASSPRVVRVRGAEGNCDIKDTSWLYAAEKCLSTRVFPEVSGRGELRGRRNYV